MRVTEAWSIYFFVAIYAAAVAAAVASILPESEEGCSVELFVLASTQEERTKEVVRNVQNVLPSIFPVPETPTNATASVTTKRESEEPLRMVYSAIAEEIGAVESDTGYTQFIEAVTEITEAHGEECSGGTDTRPSLADVPRLAREFGTLPGNARNAPELRSIFGKLLCIKGKVEETRSMAVDDNYDYDPCEDAIRVCPNGGYEVVECYQEFFACLDDEVESNEGSNATHVRAVLGIIPENYSCLGFVVDTTGSMGEEIAAVQDLILTFISGEEKEPGCYALTPFNDYGPADPHNYGPETVYDTLTAADLLQLRNDVTSLSATGGGDCPEYGMNAMMLTLRSRDPVFGLEVFVPDSGSQLIVLTDAGAKDYNLTEDVIAEARMRNVCIHFFLSHHDCSRPSAYSSYEQVANRTGGIVIHSSSYFRETLEELGTFATSYRDSPCSQFYDGGGRRRKRDLGFSDEQRCHTFRVSAFTTVLKFLVRTNQTQFTVRDPNGGIDVKVVHTDLMFASYEEYHPQTGQWSVCVETGTLSISFNNRVVLDMVVAYVKEDDSAPNRVVTTSDIPPACSTGRVALFTSRFSDISDTAPIHLNLVEDGTVRQSATLVKCGGALTGSVTFPLGSFTYHLEGEDWDGNPFRYNSRKRVELQPNNNFTLTVISAPQEVSFRASAVLNFTLQNHNSYGSTNFTISAGRVTGFTTRLLQPHISLDARASTVISLRVTAGSAIVPGSAYRFTVTAANGCTNQSASQTVRVREFMPVTEAPDACGNCQNGGTCIRIRRRGRVLLRCRCPPGYGGGHCEREY